MASAGSIKPINKHCVNQICSGQVVLTLATAVKELIENSLDAGSTSLQIRLKEFGSESLEVVDNGSGVEESNFAGLTLKHHTSKIVNFDDLTNVDTFGFRGEALSSLCTLGNVTIVTRHISSGVGNKLQFDHNGSIIANSSIARQIGTTVTVENLFSTLPVRHKEFHRNLRREFGKMCNVLQAYALFNSHCSISCSNRTGGKSRTVFETRAGSIRANIGAIFGSKQLQDLLTVESVTPGEEILEEFRCKKTDDARVNVTGFISSCAHGSGRSSTDRQYLYINCRPVDNTKISRLINDIYHQFNPHQSPFIFLDIRTDSGSVDVNVVPDKRQIMLEHESFVYATIKASLLAVFSNIPATLPIRLTVLPTESEAESPKPTSLTERFASPSGMQPSPLPRRPTPQNTQTNMNYFLTKIQSNVAIEEKLSDTLEEVCEPVVKRPKYTVTIEEAVIKDFSDEKISHEIDNEEVEQSTTESEENREVSFTETEDTTLEHINATEAEKQNEYKENGELDEGLTILDRQNRRCCSLPLTISDVKALRRKETVAREGTSIKFFAKIEPSANDRAEEELRKELCKDSFTTMKVLGQFNKGFIITKLFSDLFIIDQHATDEKFNFEKLSRDKIQSQPLTIPQQLRLTADKEELFLSCSDIVRANGFDFDVDNEAMSCQRIRLTAVPVAKGVTLGHRDVDELLFLLEGAPAGLMCRPSRVRDILASRACRMSVMVGTALNISQMNRLVNHMSEMDQPWNCPHGRPTIRHLSVLAIFMILMCIVGVAFLNTSIKTPNKLFINVPIKKVIGHLPAAIATNSVIYFCEDHFDACSNLGHFQLRQKRFKAVGLQDGSSLLRCIHIRDAIECLQPT